MSVALVRRSTNAWRLSIIFDLSSFKTRFILTCSSWMYGYTSAQLPERHHARWRRHTQWVSALYKFWKTIILSVAATFAIYMTKWKNAPKVSHLYVQRGGLQMNNRNLPSTMHRALWPGPQPSSPLTFSLSYQSTNLFGLLLYLAVFTQSNLEKPWALHQRYLIGFKQQSTRFLLPTRWDQFQRFGCIFR